MYLQFGNKTSIICTSCSYIQSLQVHNIKGDKLLYLDIYKGNTYYSTSKIWYPG